MFTTVEQVSRN